VHLRIIESAYACMARSGLAKMTVEDVARGARVSRATVYRYFPGGREELTRETVAWETQRFVERLALEVGDSEGLSELLSGALVAISRMIADHEVLQKILASEPERLLPHLTLQSARVREMIVGFTMPFIRRERLPEGLSAEDLADYLARMLLSVTLSPGGWNLSDRAQVEDLVRVELLGSLSARGRAPSGPPDGGTSGGWWGKGRPGRTGSA
jgi:AcrR family transcriptional regulator